MAKAEKTATPFTAFEALSSNQSDAVKEGMERFMSMTGQFSSLGRDSMAAASESARVAAKNMQTINARSMTYFQNQMAASAEAGKSIAGAKSVKEAMEVQVEYSKTALESYMEETRALLGLMAGSMREAVEPLNAHAAQMVEKFQSAS